MKYAYLGLQEFYRSITEAPEAIFQQNGGRGCRPARPGELGCFLLKQPSFQNVLEGPRFENFYLHPILISSPLIFVFFFGYFPFETSRNFTDSMEMGVKPSEAINNGPRMKLGCNNLFTHPHFAKYTPIFVFLAGSLRNILKLYGFHGDGC